MASATTRRYAERSLPAYCFYLLSGSCSIWFCSTCSEATSSACTIRRCNQEMSQITCIIWHFMQVKLLQGALYTKSGGSQIENHCSKRPRRVISSMLHSGWATSLTVPIMLKIQGMAILLLSRLTDLRMVRFSTGKSRLRPALKAI